VITVHKPAIHLEPDAPQKPRISNEMRHAIVAGASLLLICQVALCIMLWLLLRKFGI